LTVVRPGAESAEVVIAGGGAVGTSVAYHLTRLGVRDVVLVERETLGSGSTGKSAGGIRTQFSDALNVRIGLRALAEFEHFAELTGVDIGFHQVGYLFLLDNAMDAAAFRTAVALQRELGLDNVELTPGEAAARVPGLVTEDLVAATYSPRDGHATPEAVVTGYAGVAARDGVRILQGEPLTGVQVRAGRIVAVETPRRTIATRILVCAAGPWSREVAAMVGVDLPVVGEQRRMHFTAEDGGLPADLPLTIDFSTGFYVHREGPGLVFGTPQLDLHEVAVAVSRRLPLLADLAVQSSWTGLYEMSPDRNALVGEADGPSRFLYATGFSGHGFQQAPAVGAYLAELITGTVPSLDLGPLAVERLRRGVRTERVVV
jgi:sarcosine oxidase, subunit beta